MPTGGFSLFDLYRPNIKGLFRCRGLKGPYCNELQLLTFSFNLRRTAVAEIPAHLLARSKAKRAAAAGGGEGEPDTSTVASVAADTTASSAGAVVAAAATAAKPAKVETAIPKPSTPPPVKGLAFARITKVILMAGVPVWAFFAAGVFATPKSTTETPQQAGARLYIAQCASCHKTNGSGKEGGGVGRPLWKGEAEKTFLKAEEQIAFVRHGSCAVGVPYGNPKREGGEHVGLGGMPAFPDLTDTQIWEIITYERTVLSDKPWPEAVEGEAEAIPPTIPPLTENVCR
jgi:mono/diheme cytochrome c family protein